MFKFGTLHFHFSRRCQMLLLKKLHIDARINQCTNFYVFLYVDLHLGSDSALKYPTPLSFANFRTCSIQGFFFLMSPPCLNISTLPAISVIVFVIFLSCAVKSSCVDCFLNNSFRGVDRLFDCSIAKISDWQLLLRAL
jgi:hypothetical protein